MYHAAAMAESTAESIQPQLNPKVDIPPFAATVAAAALQLYQVDPVHQPWGLNASVSRYMYPMTYNAMRTVVPSQFKW